jgi:hypothetical protein
MLETAFGLLRKKSSWNASISAIKGSVEVYVSFLDIVLGAPSFSKIMIEQDSGRFVNEIVPLLWNAKEPIRG